MKKTVAILGLGLFGSSVAKSLASHEIEVIGIDCNMERVEEVMADCEVAIQGDFSKIEVLEEADIASVDIAIIASGEKLETAILAVLNLKKLKVPHIIVKSKNTEYVEVLKKVGADRVLLPENESGRRLGNEIAKANVIDALRIDDRYNIVEIHAIPTWIGKTIAELNLRHNYGFNLLAMRSVNQTEFQMTVSPEYIVKDEDLFVALVDEANLERFNTKYNR